MAKYLFLSPEWIEEAKKIHQEYRGGTPSLAHPEVRMNQVITGVPFGSGSLDAHLDTSSGEVLIELGHLEGPDVTLTMDYATAKDLYVDGNIQSGMQAFMSGRIKAEGDISKLMALQAVLQPGGADAAAMAAAAKVKEMTA